ncbi:solute carrier family 22 member 6-like [Saccostrea cucullata]|uniref:solute carrier family 22 member 6-like n=1 Tax=Saccostrea cuccullata TaxID=36930 RepID=UPI002ED0D2A8
MGSAAGRIGGMVSSFAALFGTYVPWGPGVVFGSLSLLATISFLWLPETTGKELSNTLQEALSFHALKDKKRKTPVVSLIKITNIERTVVTPTKPTPEFCH